VGEAVAAALGGRGRVVSLDPLPPEDLPLLADRLIALYGELHPGLPLGGGARERFLGHVRRGVKEGSLGTTRAVARLTVEYLDLFRHGRDAEAALEPDRR